jgi:NAD(P)-dependent dehydrogenase (short-subunit alcohol dehydrogenase family)
MSRRPVAVVTGAARGIGRATARALAARGFVVVLLDRDEEAARAAAATIATPTHVLGCDIADVAASADVAARIAHLAGPVDCLVNNAGIGAPLRGDVLDLAPENFDRVIAVNLRGTVFLTQAIARRMLADASDRPRSIITVTSVSAALASPERLDYCISKAGLAMFTQGLALRLAPHGIGVFDVRPGIIRTDMTEGVAARYDALIEGGLVPARRWGEPEDVAAAIVGLATGPFYATGSVVAVDGGLGIPRF